MKPNGKLKSIKELAAYDELPCESTIRKWRRDGAPFWGYKSTVDDLLAWQFGRTVRLSTAFEKTPVARRMAGN